MSLLLAPSGLSWALFAFAVGPPVVYLASEIDKSIRFGVLRGVEIADIVVAYPVWVVLMTLVHFQVLGACPTTQGQGGFSVKCMYLAAGTLLLCAFTYGHAMHWTANAINTYMTEYNLEKQLRTKVTDEVYELIYYFDEHLGHAIFFCSLHAAIFLWTFAHSFWVGKTLLSTQGLQPNISSNNQPRHRDVDLATLRVKSWSQHLVWLCAQLLPVGAGMTCGIIHAVAFIEGSSRRLGLGLSSAHICGDLILLSWCRGSIKHASSLLASGEMLRFSLALGMTVLATTATYASVFPGGQTPSQLGGWWCVVTPSRFDYCIVPEEA